MRGCIPKTGNHWTAHSLFDIYQIYICDMYGFREIKKQNVLYWGQKTNVCVCVCVNPESRPLINTWTFLFHAHPCIRTGSHDNQFLNEWDLWYDNGGNIHPSIHFPNYMWMQGCWSLFQNVGLYARKLPGQMASPHRAPGKQSSLI